MFRGFGGEVMIENVFAQLPGGVLGAFFLVMLVIFLLGFILDFISKSSSWWCRLWARYCCRWGLDPVWLGKYDCIEFANLVFNPAVWVFVVLFAQCNARIGANSHHVSRRHAVYCAANQHAGDCLCVARHHHLVAQSDLWRQLS